MATRGLIALLSLAALVAAGCGSSDDATSAETKPTEVKQNIDKGTQDQIAANLKGWKPQK